MKTPEEYLNSKGFYNTNVIRNMHHEEVKITDMLRGYAIEAIKADRERVAEGAEIERDYICGHYEPCDCARVNKQSILNLPYELL